MRAGEDDNKRPSPPSSASALDRPLLEHEHDSDDQSGDNEPGPNGKRKRPLSVSYAILCLSYPLAMHLDRSGYAVLLCLQLNCLSSRQSPIRPTR